MVGDSSKVDSSQAGVHPRLQEIVRKHRVEPYRQPVSEHTRRAFQRTCASLEALDGPMILDAGCGTGQSTFTLADRFPGSVVIGIDRSAHRLARSGCDEFLQRGNAILVRAELRDFWRLAVEAGWRCARQYLLYPNPSPKPGQLKRRWHAHPVFPAIVQLGGLLEVRTNWKIYAEELIEALQCYGRRASLEQIDAVDCLTPFERKYNLSGHTLFRVRCDLEETM